MKGLFDGFPCTSISMVNPDPKSIKDESSASGGGLKALLQLIDSLDEFDDLDWVCTENVKALVYYKKQLGERAVDIQDKAMAARNFLPDHVVAYTQQFGVPQSRSRTIGMYLKKTKLKAFMPAPSTTFLALRCEPLDISQFLITAEAKNDVSKKKMNCCKSNEEEACWVTTFQKHSERLGEDTVLKNLDFINQHLASELSSRELHVAAVAMTTLAAGGYDPHRVKMGDEEATVRGAAVCTHGHAVCDCEWWDVTNDGSVCAADCPTARREGLVGCADQNEGTALSYNAGQPQGQDRAA